MRNFCSVLSCCGPLNSGILSCSFVLALILSTISANGHPWPTDVPQKVEPAQSTSPKPSSVPDHLVTPLTIGKPVGRDMKSGDSHRYTLRLKANHYIHLVVEQQGIDVAVQCFDPKGALLVEVDSPNGTQGPEKLELVTSLAGDYQVTVKTFGDAVPPGKYLIELKDARLASAQETTRIRERLLAQKIIAEAETLRLQHTEAAHRSALIKYESAISHCQAAGELEMEVETLNNLGRINADFGDNLKALDYYNRGLSLTKNLSDQTLKAGLYTNIGAVYWGQSEIQKAADAYSQALVLWRELKNELQISVTLNNLSLCLIYFRQPKSAEPMLLEALKIQEALREVSSQATTLSNLGICSHYLSQKEKTHTYLEKALTVVNQLVPPNPMKKAELLHNLGILSSNAREIPQAFSYFKEALTLFQTAGNRLRVAETLASLAVISYEQNKLTEAISYFNQVQQLIRSEDDQLWLPEMYFTLSEIDQASGKLSEALAHLEKTIELVERRRQQVRSLDFRLNYFHDNEQYFQAYITLLMKLHAQNPTGNYDVLAFEGSERARARTLLDLLAEVEVDLWEGVDPKLLEQEHIVQATFNQKVNLWFGAKSDPNKSKVVKTLEAEIQDLNRNLNNLRAEMRAKNPRYAALTQAQTLKLTEIQHKHLDPETLLLVYSLGASDSYVWAITTTSLKSYRLPGRTLIEATAQQVYQALSWTPEAQPARRSSPPSSLPLDGNPPDCIKPAQELSQMILGPLADQLGDKRLVVVADGILNLIPFGGLPSPLMSGTSDAQADQKALFLIEQHELTQLPSVSTLAALRQKAAPHNVVSPTLFVVADPVFSATDSRVKKALAAKVSTGKMSTGKQPSKVATASSPPGLISQPDLPLELTSQLRDGQLARLSFTRLEASEISKVFSPSNVIQHLDFEASREMVFKENLSRYAYVHFATHGVFHSEQPALSGLILTLVDSNGQTQPGLLGLQDIYKLKLNAELVVLSACNSGLGKLISGEGMMGLTRVFMTAGASRVVSSLWKVDDRMTSTLMKTFYTLMIQKKMSPAQALREAQLQLLRTPQWNSPRQWAAFQLQGEWR